MLQAPDNFDWDNVSGKGFGNGYSKSDKAVLAAQYEATIGEVTENEVIKATIVDITDKDVIVSIGFKSDGLVPLAEFRDMEEIKIGDIVDVYVETREDSNGQLIVSRRKARIARAWEEIRAALENDTQLEGLVKRRTKGGLIMDIYGVEAFLPGSQIDVKPIRDFDIYVNRRMEVKVVKINPQNDNVVVSHKALIEKDLEAQKALILNNLEKGQVLEGIVKNMTTFGVFIDLGGVDGLLHITDISWSRINHPEEVLKLDDKVTVVVLDFDEEKKRISLGMKQLMAHPWDSLPADLDVNSHVKGKIVNVVDYGAFMEITPGVEGLIHVSEMSWSQHLRNPQEFLKVGDEIDAVVTKIDRSNYQISLGIKQLTEDPWKQPELLAKYATGTVHDGIVRNATAYGLFVEMEAGIDGMVHVSDLSWTRKIKDPKDFIKPGDTLKVKVLEMNAEERRIALGHRQLEPNPWDAFEEEFKVGSVHEGTILGKVEKGVTIELPYGLEAYAATKNLTKEDGSVAEVGERLAFKVLEFNKEDRRMVVSHSNTFGVAAEEKAAPEPKKKKAAKEATDNSNPAGPNEAASTSMDEGGVLAALKKSLEN
jgi:small subunit ribosomal protein S1